MFQRTAIWDMWKETFQSVTVLVQMANKGFPWKGSGGQ